MRAPLFDRPTHALPAVGMLLSASGVLANLPPQTAFSHFISPFFFQGRLAMTRPGTPSAACRTCARPPRAVASKGAAHPLSGLCWALLCAGALSGCQYTAQGKNAKGVQLFQNGQYQQSAVMFQQAIQQSPTNSDAYYNLAAAYHQVGKVNRSPTEFNQAEALYNKALDYDPNNQDAYRALAVLLVDKNQPDKAQKLLEGWYAQNPTNAGAKVELARLREEFGDKQGAKDYLQQALAIDAYDPRALAALGRLQESEGNMTQALANYQRSLFRNASQPEVAARVASLRTSVNASMQTFTPDGTRTVTTPVNPVR